MNLVFLKLGGSLITDKDKKDTPNLGKISEVSAEIAEALNDTPDLHLVLGHGSGSYGHHAAMQFGTRDGVRSPKEWEGFASVWERAHALNTILVDALINANVPLISISPSSSVITQNHAIKSWNTFPVEEALKNHLVPLVHGDVVFDSILGGTILSTEELFTYLALKLTPDRILLAGIEPGVWNDYESQEFIISKVTPASFTASSSEKMHSTSPDVTGGMGSKISSMLKIIEKSPHTSISIFSGKESGNIYSSLTGKNLGTLLTCDERG